MPAHVPDHRLRGQQRAQKAHGHAKGGNETWRNYGGTDTKSSRPPMPAESWWVGKDRAAFNAVLEEKAREAARRHVGNYRGRAD